MPHLQFRCLNSFWESKLPLSSSSAPSSRRLPTVLTLFLLALIIVVQVTVNLYWVHQNVTLIGRDAAGHLERSVVADALMTPLSPRALFAAITLTDDYRPPLLYLFSVPFYHLFGPDMDSAQALNVALLAVILGLTFVLARRWLTDGWALFATLLVGFLPMIAAMSRLYYMENLLTALLLINLLALLNSEGFTRRPWSILWGISLGLALLTKWTAPIYILLPMIYVLWQGEKQDPQWQYVQQWRINWRALAGAIGLAALLVIGWWWPSRDLSGEFLLDDWLPLCWFVLWALTIYALLLPSGRWSNWLSAGLLALSLASLWYFPQLDFTNRLSDVAFGTDRGTQQALDLTRLSNYTRYFSLWLSHHMGPLATVLILPVAVWGWLRQWRQPTNQPSPIILWLMLLSGYLALALIAQANARNLNALLPVIAILLISSLQAYRQPVALAIAAVWVLVLGGQWAIYSFNQLAPLFARTPNLWVHGDYNAWSASGSSDPGFWIQPAVLATIGSPPDEPATLGMLIDSWEIHRGSFRYLITAEQRNVRLMALTESDSRGWSDLLANQWLLLKDGDNSDVETPGQRLLERINQGDPLFQLLYREAERYPLPNGETAHLYHRSVGPVDPYKYPVVLIETAPIAETINQLWSPGATLYFGNADTATWVGIHDLVADRIVLPAAEQTVAEALADVTGTIFAVTRYDTPAVQSWLFAHSYPAVEVGDNEFHLTVVGRPAESLQPLRLQRQWADFTIGELRALPSLRLGAVLPVEIELQTQPEQPLKLSLRLLDPTGAVVAQQDRDVGPQMAYGLLLPPTGPPGDYQLVGVLYDPHTLEPIRDAQGNDTLLLTTIFAEPATH